jgi:subtilase family serine protease
MPPLRVSLLAFLLLALSAFASDQPTVPIPGSTPPAMQRAIYLNHLDPSQAITIVVALTMRNEEDLDALLERQRDKTSPDYRRWITPEDFLRDHAPSEADVRKITDFLESQGLTDIYVTPNRMKIHARAFSSQIERAFGVTMNNYELDGELHFAADRDPSLPAGLRDLVTAIVGLNSISTLHSHLSHNASPSTPTIIHTPYTIATGYNLPSTLNTFHGTKTYCGNNAPIGIATAWAYNTSDLSYWLSYFAITRTGSVTVIPVSGGSTTVKEETTTDVEWSSAMASCSNIFVYETPDSSFAHFDTMLAQIVSDNKVKVVSNSFGICEANIPTSDMNAEDASYKQGVSQGMTFVIASGDKGAYDCGGTDFNLAVDFPASDQNVVGVGGTNLYVQSNDKFKSQGAWTGSGGGISSTWTKPTWQTGPGVPSTLKMRGVPDVAFNADTTNTPYYYYINGAWADAGGTSFGAPNIAALLALAIDGNQGTSLGLFADEWYELGGSSAAYKSDMHDVTTGNNGNGVGPGYNATKNWDFATGWGTPNGSPLVSWILGDK